MFLALYHQCQALSLHFFVSSSSSETTWQNRCSLPSEARGGQGRRSGPVAWDEQEYLTFFFYRVGVYQIYILSIHTSCLEGNITIHLKSHLSLPWLQTSHLWYRLQLFFCLMLKLNKLLLHIIWNIHDLPSQFKWSLIIENPWIWIITRCTLNPQRQKGEWLLTAVSHVG